MKHNVGSFDAAARVVFGFVVIAAGHHYHTWWGLAGFVPLLSGTLEFCPLYCLFGFDTLKQDGYDDRHLPPSDLTKA